MEYFLLLQILILFRLVSFIYSNAPLSHNGTAVSGAIPKNDSYDFYTITIQDNVKVNTSSLVIKVIEDKGSLSERQDFSDVDVYVSMNETNPKNSSTSTWYSELYGDDIVTISKKHVKPKAKFYVGVYCQFKCKYKISAYLSEMIEIKVGVVQTFLIPKQSSMTFRFKSKDDFEQLNFAFMSPYMNPFKLFISNHNPSSQNTFKIQPSWISGYSLDIYKGSPEYYPGEDYRMVVESMDEDAHVRVLITYPDTEVLLRSSEYLFDAIRERKRKCYSFPIDSQHQKERIIINIVLFSGTSVIQVHGFKPDLSMTFLTIPYNSFTYEITSEKVIILSQEELDKFRAVQNGPHNLLHFCAYVYEKTSYLIGAHYASQTEQLQKLNYLLMGNTLMGYLPKNQVTKYRILDFSRDANLNITIDTIEGEPKLYGFFTQDFRGSFFNYDRLKKEIQSKNKNLTEGEETYKGYDLEIPSKDNICHSLIKPNNNLNDELKKLSCGLFAIVYCDPGEAGKDCVYRIRVINEKTIQRVFPRTTFFNILGKDEKERYTFDIDDEKVDSISVVQNTISGEATLYLYYVNPTNKNLELIAYSVNKFYLPNVITITKENLLKNNMIGTYQISVQASSFSTYSLYYYTHLKEEEKKNSPKLSDIELNLELGEIIQGFFTPTTKYKIYSFESLTDLKSNLRITLTRRNMRFILFVYTDLGDIQIETDSKGNENFKGYKWKSGFGSQIIIKQTDLNFSGRGPYYIVVFRDLLKATKRIPDIESYYLGITDEEEPFLLYEGMQHSAQLNSNYTGQGYWYMHQNISESFNLALNLQYGSVKVYIDFKEFNRKTLMENVSSIYYISGTETESDFIALPPEILKKKCDSDSEISGCILWIYIDKVTSSSSQYSIITRSKDNSPFYLYPGNLFENEMNTKEIHHYIIEKYDSVQGGNILVKFKYGGGNVFMNVNEGYGNEAEFPNETSFQFKGEESYMGKILKIPKLKEENCNPCRFLVTIKGSYQVYSSDMIKYSILYSNQAVQINLDKPLKNEIKTGELHYYRVYFDESAPSIYVSLYSNDGDTDLYMNYGTDLPTYLHHDWKSANPQMDFITVDKNDPLFVSNNKANLEGYYTILVYGYTDSTYTLYVTTNPNRIIRINNNEPGSCLCENEGDKCYFRYDNLFDSSDDEEVKKQTKDISIAFSSNFVYGSGNQYVKLYKETDFDIKRDLPSNSNYDYSNVDQNKRNFIKVDIKKDNKFLTRDSMLILTLQCKEKSLVELNAARILNATFQYLDFGRENLFYLEQSKKPTILSFYYSKKKIINYEVYTFTGKANILIFQNTTTYNRSDNKNSYSYNHIAQFQINKSKSPSYFNYLNPLDQFVGKNIYFKVTPDTDVGFFIKLTYETEWTRVDIGKTQTFQVNGDSFYGYFDLSPLYQDVIITVKSELSIKIYAKVNIYERTVKENANSENPFGLTYPTKYIYDYSGVKNNVLESVSIKIKKINSNELLTKNGRVLFYVDISGEAIENIMKSITITVSPSIGGSRRVSASPLNLYFSSEKEVNADKTIFDLKKIKEDDDIFVIMLSSCKGKFDSSLTGDVYSNEKSKLIQTEKKEKYGRIILTSKNMKQSNYYLSVWGTEKPESTCNIKEKEQDLEKCSTDIEYLLYYYTTSSETYAKLSMESYLVTNQISRKEIEIIIGRLTERDVYGNTHAIETFNYKLFISTEEEDFEHMSSLCFLSQRPRALPQGVKAKYDLKRKKFIVNGLKTGVKYYMNLIIENPKTGEWLTLNPTVVQLNIMNRVSLSVFILLIIAITLLGCGLYYFYSKYKKTKAILNYESNDIHNLGRLPTTEAELSTISARDEVKYKTLTSEAQNI